MPGEFTPVGSREKVATEEDADVAIRPHAPRTVGVVCERRDFSPVGKADTVIAVVVGVTRRPHVPRDVAGIVRVRRSIYKKDSPR